jgi:hypothetical protein
VRARSPVWPSSTYALYCPALYCHCRVLPFLPPNQVKAKGARKITYEAFLKALDAVAAKKVCAARRMCRTQGHVCCSGRLAGRRTRTPHACSCSQSLQLTSWRALRK